ncbi:hypothetical protein GCM10020254_73510 [Streptomyces goshikiensis]
MDGLADQAFLDRLPALRGGFDALSPAARGRLLDTVTERLGDRIGVSLDAPPALLALWAAADAAGLAALKSLPLPAPATGTADAAGPGAPAAPGATGRGPAAADQRLAPADRWRLLLGRQRDRLPADARRYARALDELYGAGRGEGASDVEGGAGRGGGQDPPSPPPASGRRSWRPCSARTYGRRCSPTRPARGAPMCWPSSTRRSCAPPSSC